MTHEFIKIIDAYSSASKQGLHCVLITVVDLNGSSYRKPGVRMLITEHGEWTGAISGGCVEKEIERQSKSVFSTGLPKIMTYDGRYRLGCEGLIYILIEPFAPNQSFVETFYETINNRLPFTITSYYSKELGSIKGMGSLFVFANKTYSVQAYPILQSFLFFKQELPPNFRLCIFGSEHDAVELCKFSALCGWDVDVFSSSPEIRLLHQFSKAKSIQYIQPKEIKNLNIDSETAIVLMTHNFAKDLAYLIEFAQHSHQPNYIGIIGSTKRMRQLESSLFEQLPYLDEPFIERLHGPAGLNIGSITPQEIAISILSEITQNVRLTSKVVQNSF